MSFTIHFLLILLHKFTRKFTTFQFCYYLIMGFFFPFFYILFMFWHDAIDFNYISPIGENLITLFYYRIDNPNSEHKAQFLTSSATYREHCCRLLTEPFRVFHNIFAVGLPDVIARPRIWKMILEDIKILSPPRKM